MSRFCLDGRRIISLAELILTLRVFLEVKGDIVLLRQAGRIVVVVIIVTAVFLAVVPGQEVLAATLEVKAKGAVLMEGDTGEILWEQNPDAQLYPASMTKIMTMILVLEAVEQGRLSLNDEVVASERAASFGGTQVWLEPGEKFTVEELLKAVAVGSANDASVALAEHLAGSEEAFVEIMNEKARAIGATHTHFANSHGLHNPDHYTTPRDMAVIARYGLRFPHLLELTSIKEYTFREEPELVLYNTNKLLWWYAGVDGLKTGTTSEAGRNLCATANRDGLRLISVVMGSDIPKGNFSESMKVLGYGFASYEFKEFYPAGAVVGEAVADKGQVDKVPVIAEHRVGAVIPKGQKGKEDVRLELQLPERVSAPLPAGMPLGQALVKQGDRELNRVNVLVAADVPRASLWQEMGKVLTRTLTISPNA